MYHMWFCNWHKCYQPGVRECYTCLPYMMLNFKVRSNKKLLLLTFAVQMAYLINSSRLACEIFAICMFKSRATTIVFLKINWWITVILMKWWSLVTSAVSVNWALSYWYTSCVCISTGKKVRKKWQTLKRTLNHHRMEHLQPSRPCLQSMSIGSTP